MGFHPKNPVTTILGVVGIDALTSPEIADCPENMNSWTLRLRHARSQISALLASFVLSASAAYRNPYRDPYRTLKEILKRSPQAGTCIHIKKD